MGLRGGLVGKVEGLGIVLRGEIDHLLAGHRIAAKGGLRANLEVLEIDQPFLLHDQLPRLSLANTV